MDIEIRGIIHYFFPKERSAKSAHAEIISLYGAGTIAYSGVTYWYKEFRQGRTDIQTRDRAGRPVDNYRVEEIRTLLNDMPFLSARAISSLLSMSRKQVTRMLKVELGLIKKHARWIPHFLTDEQKAQRVELSKAMLKVLNSLSPNQRACVVTGDESWFYLRYSYDSKWCEEYEKTIRYSKVLTK